MGNTRWREDPWRPDLKLWGGDPMAIMTDFPGKELRRPLDLPARPVDLYLSTWDGEGTYPPSSKSWIPAEPYRSSDSLTFSSDELVIRYHETTGRMDCSCGYCEERFKSRNLEKLLRWWRLHQCVYHPIWNPPRKAEWS